MTLGSDGSTGSIGDVSSAALTLPPFPPSEGWGSDLEVAASGRCGGVFAKDGVAVTERPLTPDDQGRSGDRRAVAGVDRGGEDGTEGNGGRSYSPMDYESVGAHRGEGKGVFERVDGEESGSLEDGERLRPDPLQHDEGDSGGSSICGGVNPRELVGDHDNARVDGGGGNGSGDWADDRSDGGGKEGGEGEKAVDDLQGGGRDCAAVDDRGELDSDSAGCGSAGGRYGEGEYGNVDDENDKEENEYGGGGRREADEGEGDGGGEGEGEGEGEEGGGRGSPALHVPQSSGSQSPNEAEEGNSPAQGPESRLRSDPAGSSPAADGGSLPTAAEIIRARAARWEPGSGGGGGQRPQTKPREAPGGGGGGRGGGGGGGDHRGSGGGGEQTVQTVSRHR